MPTSGTKDAAIAEIGGKEVVAAAKKVVVPSPKRWRHAVVGWGEGATMPPFARKGLIEKGW